MESVNRLRGRVRVAHLHTNREWGGGEHQVLHLARAQKALGLGCVLLTPREGALWGKAKQVGIWTEPLSPQTRLSAGAHGSVLNVMREMGINLLHAHDSTATGHGVWLKRHHPACRLVLSRRIASPLRRNPRSRRKYSSASLDGVLAISETVKRVFCESGYPEERVWVAPSGLDLAALSALANRPDSRRETRARPLIGGLGKLSDKKNWTLMVETAAVLKARGRALDWALAGEGPEAGSLRTLAAERGVSDEVTFLGFRHDAQALLCGFDLLFFPSRVEGASVTVREAMALGVPVVAARAAGTMESLDGSGWIIDPDDPEAAADAVEQVLDNADARNERVEAAKAIALSRYSLENMVGATLKGYDRLFEEQIDAD